MPLPLPPLSTGTPFLSSIFPFLNFNSVNCCYVVFVCAVQNQDEDKNNVDAFYQT